MKRIDYSKLDMGLQLCTEFYLTHQRLVELTHNLQELAAILEEVTNYEPKLLEEVFGVFRVYFLPETQDSHMDKKTIFCGTSVEPVGVIAICENPKMDLHIKKNIDRYNRERGAN